MRKELAVILALTFSGTADGLFAGAAAGPADAPFHAPPSTVGADFFPLGLAAYSTQSAAFAPAPSKPAEGAFGGPLARAAGPATSLRAGEGESSSRRRYLPVVMSLLVPGAGEIYMGYYVRGAALVAAEIGAWTGYAYYHDKGLDSRAEYERFADAHWSYGKWIDDHALWRDPAYVAVDPTFEALDSIGQNYWDGWPPYHSWHSREEEKQNYYENIGKYDWFISGWEDWDAEARPRESGLRTTYRAMRKKSNDELDNATAFIYLSVAARVVSLVQTLILTRGDDSGGAEESPSPGFSLSARATGPASGEVALVYRFR